MRILIVEDDPERVVRFYRWYSGQCLTVVNNADDAVASLKTVRYDVVFLDHDLGHMPDFDNRGMTVAKAVASTINTGSTFVVHSMNSSGAENMSSYLKQSCPEARVFVMPFAEEFENLIHML